MDDEEKPDSKEHLRIFPVGKKVRNVRWVSGLHFKHTIQVVRRGYLDSDLFGAFGQ